MTKATIAKIVESVATHAGLKPAETAWLKGWAAKWTADFISKPEFTPAAILTMTKNAAAFAVKAGA